MTVFGQKHFEETGLMPIFALKINALGNATLLPVYMVPLL